MSIGLGIGGLRFGNGTPGRLGLLILALLFESDGGLAFI
jgi:hypothetical protein